MILNKEFYDSVLGILLPIIKRFEGLRLKAYYCPAGVLTIGYGHTKGVKPSDVWTKEKAESKLINDVPVYINGTIKLCPTLETPEQVAAISDFSYNLGLTRLKASTLRRKILRRDWPGAQRELKRWVYGGGKKLPGLILRRNIEANLI